MAFYNQDMLGKRGPLARVWMASHLSSKLSKSTLLSTDIPQSITSILGASVLPTLALRLSGQLLLGVARIYSRKTKYLLDDCQEVLSKVKKAFASSAGGGKGKGVDLEEGGERRADGITLRREEGGLEDILNFDAGNYWDVSITAASTSKSRAATTSSRKDITLTDRTLHLYTSSSAHLNGAGGAYDDLEIDEDGNVIDHSGTNGFDYGPEGGLDGLLEDDVGLDLGLGWGDEEVEVDAPEVGRKRKASVLEGEEEDDDAESVELGRRRDSAAGGRSSVVDDPFDRDGDFDMGGGDKDGGGIGGDQLDLGGMEQEDFFFDNDNGGAAVEDDVFRDVGDFGDEARERTPRPSSARDGSITPSASGTLNDTLNLTPKTAADLAKRAQIETARKEKKAKRQIVDRVTELDWEGQDQAEIRRRKEGLFTSPKFLPRSRTHLRLLERSNDPNYYLPTVLDAKTGAYNFAPPGLAPELADLFTFSSRRSRIKAQGREALTAAASGNGNGEGEVELGREREASLFDGDDVFRDIGDHGDQDIFRFEGEEGEERQADGYEPEMEFGADGRMGAGSDVFQFDLDEDAGTTAAAVPKTKRQKLSNAGHDQSEGFEDEAEGEEGVARRVVSEGPLAVFDDFTSSGPSQTQQTQTQTQTGQTVTHSLNADEESEALGEEETGLLGGGKWSKNTVKAVGVLRESLVAVAGGQEEAVREDAKVEFGALAKQASINAKATMFFELLVLSTRDCVKLEQMEAFGEIKIAAREKLWKGDLAV